MANFGRFVEPNSYNHLFQKGESLCREDGYEVAKIIANIPRFVNFDDNYSTSFGWQWTKWVNELNFSQNKATSLKELILNRTGFSPEEMRGKTILECGAGGGNDTEVLLSFPFTEIHSFDLSYSIDAVAKRLDDPRLTLSQASITEIPYPDESFDMVYCHRVLQHTPNPVESLKSIMRKVKAGGILFAHSYKRSEAYMREWRYKYRWLTARLPLQVVYAYVFVFGWPLHYLNRLISYFHIGRKISHDFIPFYSASFEKISTTDTVTLERLITFDALTPFHDHPMSPEEFFGTIENGGFRIINKCDPDYSPMWCTAIKQ